MGDVKTSVHFQRFAQLRDSFIVAACVTVIAAQVRVDDERERIELDGSLSLGDRVLEPAQSGQSDVAILLVRNRVIWVQLNGALKFPIRLRGIEIVKPNRERQRGTRFSESVVQLKGLLCRRLSFRVRISRSAGRVAG